MRIDEVIEGPKLSDIKLVYHGVAADPEDEDFSPEGFEKLKRGIVDLSFSSGGYFGYGFYVTEDSTLARSNYAGPKGYIFQYQINPSRILDLRVSEDFDRWKVSKLDKQVHNRAMPLLAVKMGIDGVYDRSMGGMCVYNTNILRFLDFKGPLK